MKRMLILYLCSILAACSALEVAKTLLPGAANGGISADLQVGDKEQAVALGGTRGTGNIEVEDEGSVEVNTVTQNSNIEKAKEVVINNGPKPWVLLVLVLGWVAPTPSEMWRRFRLWRKKK